MAELEGAGTSFHPMGTGNRTLNNPQMDCREFRNKHLSYVDDMLPGVELVGMQLHLTECVSCARQDATVRRSLMLIRSLQRIEPSPGFSERLEKKLREAKALDAASKPLVRPRKFAAAVAATSVVMLGYIALSLRQVDTPRDIMLSPVVATLPESVTAPMTSPAPAMVASVPAGLPIWTAALFAEQVPIHFVSADLTLVNSNR